MQIRTTSPDISAYGYDVRYARRFTVGQDAIGTFLVEPTLPGSPIREVHAVEYKIHHLDTPELKGRALPHVRR